MLRIFTTFFLCLPIFSFPQDLVNFQSYSVKDGLSDNRVYNIVQDDRGFIWLGTANGLNFFDGKRFTVFKTSNSEIKEDQIFEIRKGRTHELLLATGHGAILMDTRTGIMKLLTVPAPPGLINMANTVRHIEYTSNDEIILGTNLGAYVIDRNGNLIDSILTDLNSGDVRLKWTHYVRGLASFTNGDVLISTMNGFYMYEHRRKKIIFSNAMKKTAYKELMEFMEDHVPSYIYEINKFDQVFLIDHLAAIDSIYIFDLSQKKVVAKKLPFQVKDYIRWDSRIQFHNDSLISITTARKGYYLFSYDRSLPEINMLSGEHASSLFPQYILQDRSNQFWIATESGFLKEKNNTPRIRNISIKPFILKDSYHQVSALYSTDKRYWVGCYSKESGLLVLDTSFEIIKRIDFIKKPEYKNFVVSIVPWAKDTLLIGTKFGPFFLNIRNYNKGEFTFPGPYKNLSGIIIEKYFRDSKGILWLSGGQTGGVWQIDQKQKSIKHYKPGRTLSDIPLKNAGAFAEDINGDIWMVHWQDGLSRWNRKKELFDTVITQWPVKGLVGFNCSGITRAKEGGFWFFINSYGLVKYDFQNNSFQRIIAISDKADDNTDCLRMIGDRKLWMNLRHSILIYDVENHRLVSLTSKNGLPDEANTGETMYYDSGEQTIAIGFSNAFSLIDINSVETSSSNPKVFICEIKNLITGNLVDFNRPFQLNNKTNDIRVTFAMTDIHHTIPSPEFEYRLTREENWKPVGSDNFLNLNNLPPGSYQLQVRMAGTNTSLPDKPSLVDIRVIPPFHKTIWFYLALLLSVSSLIFLFYRIRKRQILVIQNVRNKISSDLHDDLGSRLTNIRFLSTIGKDKSVSLGEKEQYLKKISEEALASGEALDEIVRNMKIHDEELEDIIARMRHYANSVFDNDSTELKIYVGENIASKKLNLEKRRDLLLAFKEILSNVKKHAGARKVNIQVKTEGECFRLIVQDDGQGFETDLFTDRNGLKNIQSRIRKWKGKVNIISAKRKGTTIDIDLPF